MSKTFLIPAGLNPYFTNTITSDWPGPSEVQFGSDRLPQAAAVEVEVLAVGQGQQGSTPQPHAAPRHTHPPTGGYVILKPIGHVTQ